MDKQVLRRYDRAFIQDIVDEGGFLTVKVAVTRPGVFPYKKADGTIQYELKHPEDIFSDITISSANSKPITDKHPGEPVNTENVKKYIKGMTHNDASVRGGCIMVTETVFDKGLINDIMEDKKREVSIGFDTTLIPERGEYNGQQYDFKQTNVVINHIAHVEQGRAGPEVGVRSDSDAWEIEENSNINKGGKVDMSMVTVRLDGKDYEVPENVKAKLDELSAKVETLDSVKSERDTTKGENETLKGENETLQGKLDSKNDEINTLNQKVEYAEKQKPSQEEIDKAVTERLSLVDTARDFVEDFDPAGKTDKDIKVMVIQALDKEFDPAERSDEYIQARFDGAVNVLKNVNSAPVGNRNVKTGDSKNENRDDGIDKKREKRINLRKKD